MASALIVNVTIISIVSSEYIEAIPGYEAGVDYAHRMYPDVKINYVRYIHQEFASCVLLSYDLTYLASEYFYKDRTPSDLYIFSSPLCVPELLLFSPLANHWNTLVLATAGNDPRISDRSVYPINLTCAAHNNHFLQLFMDGFFRTFNWTTIYMLCDLNDTVSYYQVTCNSMISLLQVPFYTLTSRPFDSRKGPPDYTSFLKEFTSVARVMIISARADLVRSVMITASRLNMTGEEYVYLQAYPYIQPPGYPELIWQMNDEDDEIARTAFTSLLSITFDNENSIYGLPTEAQTDIIERSKNDYNITYSKPEMISAATVVAFQAVLVTATVLHEIIQDQVNGTNGFIASALSDVKKVAKTFWNRTFTLPTGELYFNEDGDHFPDILLRQFNARTGKYENAVRFGGATRLLVSERKGGLYWPQGHPPNNEPLCGYMGSKSRCIGKGDLLTPLATTFCIVLVGAVTGGVYRIRHYATRTSKLWKLDPAEIEVPGLTKKRLSMLKQLERRLAAGKPRTSVNSMSSNFD